MPRRRGPARSSREREHRAARHGGSGVLCARGRHLQLELRRYVRRDGSTRERGAYWYFHFHEGGKRKKLYLGKTDDPEATLAAKRTGPLGE